MDTTSFELRLPDTKLVRLKGLLRVWKTKKSCIRKDLESSLGHLSHAALVVRPGRTFLRMLFAILHGTRALHHFTRLSAGARADLAWWWCFLQSWNGVSFFPPATVGHCIHSSFRCIGYLWLRGFPKPVQVFYISVAPTVAWCRYLREGDGANCDGSCLVVRVLEW